MDWLRFAREIVRGKRKSLMVTGALQSKFGPASYSYFAGKKVVNTQHRYGDLNENSVLEYAEPTGPMKLRLDFRRCARYLLTS